MGSVVRASSARKVVAVSVVARLPTAMLDVGLVVHARQLTGSFAAAGLAAGCYALGVGLGGPLLGRFVDRRGQTSVLLTTAGVSAGLLLTIAELPKGAPLNFLCVLAAILGLAAPPVGACLRAHLPALVADPDSVERAFALEASTVEVTYILGPPMALCIGELWSTGAALAFAAVVMLGATTAFAMQPALRSWRPVQVTGPARSPFTPRLWTLVLVLAAVGMLLGADEVGVIAAARSSHHAAAAAALFAVWGTGSFLGGLLYSRASGIVRTAGRLALLLGVLTAGHAALIPASRNVVALAGVLLVAGAAIAPTEASLNTMVEEAVPNGAITEAFSWLATAMAVGGAMGTAAAGIAADHGGAASAFAVGAVAGVLAVLATLLRAYTFSARPPDGTVLHTAEQLNRVANL